VSSLRVPFARAQAKSVSAFLIDVKVEKARPLSAWLPRVEGYSRPAPPCPPKYARMNIGGVSLVTWVSFDKLFTRSGAGSLPSRLFLDPWWVKCPW
jgi:hypothetical protein